MERREERSWRCPHTEDPKLGEMQDGGTEQWVCFRLALFIFVAFVWMKRMLSAVQVPHFEG